MKEIHTPRRLQARRGEWVPKAAVAATALVAAGIGLRVLTVPSSSAAEWRPVGMSVASAPDSEHAQQIGTLAPGVPGANTFVLATEQPPTYGHPQPAADITAVTARAVCSCAGTRGLVLQPNAGRTAWAANVDLPAAGRWTFHLQIDRATRAGEKFDLVENVVSSHYGGQEVIGVPADLAGPDGQRCRDQALGAQVALADVDATAPRRATRARLDVVDLGGGMDAAMSRLAGLGARAIALPCGDDATVAAVVRQARAAGLPVVLGAPRVAAPPIGPGVWSAVPDFGREGGAIGAQVRTQAAGPVEVVTGRSPIDAAEAAGLRRALAGFGQKVRYDALPTDAVAWARTMPHYNVVVLLLGPSESGPLLGALGSDAVREGARGLPGRGVIASTQLMNTEVMDAAWPITRIGAVEFASDVNPFDPVVQYYIRRLSVSAPGVRPTVDGIHGYDAALALAEAMRVAGGDPSGPRLVEVVGSKLTGFRMGSWGVAWTSTGGSANRVAFFRTTYLNPVAMPYESPGGAVAHMGALLGDGGFEQVAPFRRLS